MTPTRHFDDLFAACPQVVKAQILKHAGLARLSDILVSSGEALGRRIGEYRTSLLKAMLRTIDISNADMARVLDDNNFLSTLSTTPNYLKLRLTFVAQSYHTPGPSEFEHHQPKEQLAIGSSEKPSVSITDLASTSVMISELSLHIAAAFPAFYDVQEPPQAVISSGSIEYAIGGGLLASGVGLVVACGSGLVAAPVLGAVGGVALAAAGTIELILKWKARLMDMAKVAEEITKLKDDNDAWTIQQKRRLADLEVQKKEIELAEARSKLAPENVALSQYVPAEIVSKKANEWGIPEELALHLLNKGLPVFLQLRPYFSSIEASKVSR